MQIFRENPFWDTEEPTWRLLRFHIEDNIEEFEKIVEANFLRHEVYPDTD